MVTFTGVTPVDYGSKVSESEWQGVGNADDDDGQDKDKR